MAVFRLGGMEMTEEIGNRLMDAKLDFRRIQGLPDSVCEGRFSLVSAIAS